MKIAMFPAVRLGVLALLCGGLIGANAWSEEREKDKNENEGRGRRLLVKPQDTNKSKGESEANERARSCQNTTGESRIRLAPTLETRPPEITPQQAATFGPSTYGPATKPKLFSGGDKGPREGSLLPARSLSDNPASPLPRKAVGDVPSQLPNYNSLKGSGQAHQNAEPRKGLVTGTISPGATTGETGSSTPRTGLFRDRGSNAGSEEKSQPLVERLRQRAVEAGVINGGGGNAAETLAAKPPENNNNSGKTPRTNQGGGNNFQQGSGDNSRRGIQVGGQGSGPTIMLKPRDDDHEHEHRSGGGSQFQHGSSQGGSVIRLGPVTIGVPNSGGVRVGGPIIGNDVHRYDPRFQDPRYPRYEGNRTVIVPHGDHFHVEKVPGNSAFYRSQSYPKHVATHYQNWYHGCWHDTYSYAPLGSNAWINLSYGSPSLWWRTGYVSFCNPYYVRPPVVVYDYARPFTIVERPAELGADDITRRDAVSIFDGARAAFRLRDYGRALQLIDQALTLLPDDAVMHEFRALALFAVARYDEAAAVLNSLLASTPGWDWATVASLYDSVDEYTEHLRRLEAFRREKATAAGPRFVLAYHYLITGFRAEAAAELKKVVELEPRDTVAQKLLEGLRASLPKEALEAPPAPGKAAAQPNGPVLSQPVVPPVVDAGAEGLAIPLPSAGEQSVLKPNGNNAAAGNPAAAVAKSASSLAGVWSAQRDDGSQFSLELGTNGTFSWQAKTGEQTHKLAGKFTQADTLLVLEGAEGALVGRLANIGPDKFHFTLVGGPPNDPGLDFEKVKVVK